MLSTANRYLQIEIKMTRLPFDYVFTIFDYHTMHIFLEIGKRNVVFELIAILLADIGLILHVDIFLLANY